MIDQFMLQMCQKKRYEQIYDILKYFVSKFTILRNDGLLKIRLLFVIIKMCPNLYSCSSAQMSAALKKSS